MKRRAFLQLIPAAGALLALPASAGAIFRERREVMTVLGRIPASELGLTLTHEHAMANFQPYAEWVRAPHAYERAEVLNRMLPFLARIRGLGCRTFVDATAVGLGRDVRLLRELSERSGLHILTVTGNYAAANYQFLADYVYQDSPAALAQRWITEWRDGVDGTTVRPGFIKLSVNGEALSEVERKLIEAGAIAHRATGLPLGVHTGLAKAAYQQLEILDVAGVDASAWSWIHAQNEPDPAQYLAAARRGAWISLDGVTPDTLETHLDRVMYLREAGLLNRLLVSQDSGWYTVGEPGGGNIRGYDTVFTDFIPMLEKRGVTRDEIARIFVANPAEALAVWPRLTKQVTTTP